MSSLNVNSHIIHLQINLNLNIEEGQKKYTQQNVK